MLYKPEGIIDTEIEERDEEQESDLTVPRKSTRENNAAKCSKEEASPATKKQKPPGTESKQVNLNQMKDMRMVEVEITESAKEENEKQDREVRKE